MFTYVCAEVFCVVSHAAELPSYPLSICVQNGLTALLAAASSCHSEVVRMLLKRGANVNDVDQVMFALKCA